MSLKIPIKIIGFLICVIFMQTSCVSPRKAKPITISEQIVLDMQKSKDLMADFQRRINRAASILPETQAYLNKIALQLAKQEFGFGLDSSISVKIFQEASLSQTRFFSFPGTSVFMPLEFLKEVQYENELAAAIAYELANVIHRYLAKRLDSRLDQYQLFGEKSVFDFNRTERSLSIEKATELLHKAHYDTRGLASLFQRYSHYVDGDWKDDSDLEKKEVSFNIREAQRVKSQFAPLRDPIVWSNDFLIMKKKMKP